MTTPGLLAVVAVVGALVVTACGGDGGEAKATSGVERSTTSSSAPEADPVTTSSLPAPPPEGALEVTAEVPTRIPAGPHTWQFEITNVTDAPLTLVFPTAQRGDAVVEGDDGTAVHRWSEDRFFAQQVQEISLAAGQSETIELGDDLSGVEPGYYRVVLAPALLGEVDPLDRSIRIVEPGT